MVSAHINLKVEKQLSKEKYMKNILKSRTIWDNGITAVVTILTFFQYTPNQELAEMLTGFLLVTSPLRNIIWRYLTTKAITFQKS